MSESSGAHDLWTIVLRSAATTLLVGVLYAVMPVASDHRGASLMILIVGLVVLTIVVLVRLRQIQRNPQPVASAIETLALIIPLFLAVFAWTYLSLSQSTPSSFTEPLSRVDAIYFTIVVVGTVGFGDIAPRTDLARIFVSIQIILGITLLTAVVRVVFDMARHARPPSPPTPPPH